MLLPLCVCISPVGCQSKLALYTYHNYISATVSSLSVSKPVKQHIFKSSIVFVCQCLRCCSAAFFSFVESDPNHSSLVQTASPIPSTFITTTPPFFTFSLSNHIIFSLPPPPLSLSISNTHPYTQQPACTNTNRLVVSYCLFQVLSLFLSVFIFIKSS